MSTQVFFIYHKGTGQLVDAILALSDIGEQELCEYTAREKDYAPYDLEVSVVKR